MKNFRMGERETLLPISWTGQEMGKAISKINNMGKYLHVIWIWNLLSGAILEADSTSTYRPM